LKKWVTEIEFHDRAKVVAKKCLHLYMEGIGTDKYCIKVPVV